MKTLPLLSLFPLVAIATASGSAEAYETPQYDVLHERGKYEIRRYAPYLIAETTVDGDFETAGNRAFRILADYIFGNNSRSEGMEMTAPVETRQADGTRMAMTAPVESKSTGNSQWTYSFVMEREYSLATLPKPNDPRITIRRVPAQTVAAHRYSGISSEEDYEKHEALLLSALAADNVAVTGEPRLARYDSPFTLWFLRRNEVLVDVDWAQTVSRNRPIR